jgi:uncharacterized protein YeaC (DUF1315 family)
MKDKTMCEVLLYVKKKNLENEHVNIHVPLPIT